MFYEVRIYDAKKKLKKILSSQELSQLYWKKINDQEMVMNPGPSRIKMLSAEMRRKLDAQILEFLPH